MSSKQEIVDLLQEQFKEIADHKEQCKGENCQTSLSVIQSVIECIQEDMMEENREWTQNDINDWKSTMDSQGLCQEALEIFHFVEDCLYKSKQFASDNNIQTKQAKMYEEEDKQNEIDVVNQCSDLQMDNFFQTQVGDDEIIQDQEFLRRQEIINKIKLLEESIQKKQTLLEETENKLQLQYKEEGKQQDDGGWGQYEKEKVEYLKAKQDALGQLEDIFLEINSIQELVDVREEIKNCIQNYSLSTILKIQQDIEVKLKNYSFVVDDALALLKQMELWTKKYPICTDRNINLFIEIEKDNLYLNTMMQKVNNTYNDQMLEELEGLHSVLSELESVRNSNNNLQK